MSEPQKLTDCHMSERYVCGLVTDIDKNQYYAVYLIESGERLWIVPGSFKLGSGAPHKQGSGA